MTEPASRDDLAAVQKCEQAYNRIRDELLRVIVGRGDVIERVRGQFSIR